MHKYKVMLVDDEIVILQGYQKLFDWKAYDCEVVAEAMDGISAISMFEKLRPDIMLLDINIPIVSGLEVLKVVHQYNKNVQCIMITGYDDFDYCREALRDNALDYMLKPVDYGEMATIIEKAIHNLNSKEVLDKVRRNFTADDGEMKQITQMINWMNEHLQEDVSLHRLSEEFHLNSTYISQMFRTKLGINYHTYLNQIRMNRAKELLATTDMSITDIASVTGYNDYRTFTRAFRNATGETPSRHRK